MNEDEKKKKTCGIRLLLKNENLSGISQKDEEKKENEKFNNITSTSINPEPSTVST